MKQTVVWMMVLLAAHDGSAQQRQLGLNVREVSPEIIRKMQKTLAELERREAGGIGVEEQKEFEKLRAADAELMRRVAANARKFAELEALVATLDISVDTRLLTKAGADIDELKRSQQRMEDELKAGREGDRNVILSIKTGISMLLIGLLVGLIGSMLKWVLLDPRQRKKMLATAVQQDTERVAQVVAMLDEIKKEVFAGKEDAQLARCEGPRRAQVP